MIGAIPATALHHHVAVLGKTGSGKTSTAKVLVEGFVEAGERVCILDPIKSDWWGLTSSEDGKRPGLPFHILGGPHGHVELASSAGKGIGELVAHGDLPLSIIDMADFEPGGQGRFFIDFAETLLKQARGVVHLVLEEAHLFAPKERSGIGNENMAIHWAKMLATAGRSKGVRLILATQRTQALHNAMLGSCETMIAHRLTAPADQKPVMDWLKANVAKDLVNEIAESLSSLKTGTAWVCSGEAQFFEKVEFPRITTFDNSATPTGDMQAQAVRAPVDLDHLLKLLSQITPPAAGKAQHMKAPDPKAIEAAEARGYARGLAEGIQRVQSVVAGITPGEVPAELAAPAPSLPVTLTRPVTPKRVETAPAPTPKASGGITASGHKMLRVLTSCPGVKMTWQDVAVLSVLSATGGSFNTAKKSLIDSGLVVVRDGTVSATTPSEAPDGVDSAAIVDAWARKLGGSASRILLHLNTVETARTKPEIAEFLCLSPTGGSWNTAWKMLRDNNLVVEQDGRWGLCPILEALEF